MNLTSQNAERVERQSFTFVTRFTGSSTVAKVDLNPVESGAASFFGPSLVNFANLYQQFRFVDLCVTIYPHAELPTATANASTLQIMGYTPMTSATAPSTAADIAALSESVVQVSGCSLPVKFKLNRKMLLRGAAVKWFHCDTTPDPDTGVQGQVHYIFAGTNSTTIVATWVVHCTIECRAPVAFGQFLERFKALGPVGSSDEKSDLTDEEQGLGLQPAPHTDQKLVAVKVADLSEVPDGTVLVYEDELPRPAVIRPFYASSGCVQQKKQSSTAQKGPPKS